MGRKRLAAILAVSLLAACGNAEPTATPGGPDRVLLQYVSEGGFVPVDWVLRLSPLFTLTTDGLLISQGFTDLRYPGPLVPPFVATRLTDGELRQIFTLIERMGLPGITEEHDESGSDLIADAPTEKLTYWDSNGTHEYSAYAPGMGTGTPTSKTAALVEIRTVLEQLTFNGEQVEYEPARARIIIGDGEFFDPEFAEERDWPLDETDISGWADLAGMWKCKAFPAEVLSRFTEAHQAMVWKSPNPSEDTLYTFVVRALLPGEPDCPSLD